ncbi:PEP-CTERM sorting domain-containing protein [Nitrosospira sp. Is2]|uniref:PEP-CTERM sorting domain-containing protein n=1 Tax=Nitrosospira sp. Is2 TaxID=3080532 RepID=UPI0029535A60|nr:PEP-CTERM sorting domain-containing protein [Nitrosospira sp. Is2]WON75433.1 PEP-CTERM sorting domain-containing protein [Nitrosospira sp. Is2]
MALRALGTLSGASSVAFAINNMGQVVGYSETAKGAHHAFIRNPNGMGMRDLGTLGGIASEAADINDAGQVVGFSDTDPSDPFARHAFITGPNGVGMRDLGTLGGIESFAYGINAAGQVVGSFATAGGVNYAFITGPDGEGMMNLNSLVNLPDGLVLTEAYGINNMGQVIAVGIIPEPEISVLLFAGLALVGFVARQKRNIQWNGSGHYQTMP